ncbi:hypothetical protein HAPAU_28440 [Halalkalicoccus paucihalophilus]|uniref:Uncharacterized protein n=1 Tax=Halalkalicoccus paucihalophilus TaxID=1008153 RepID=A0A151ABN3_9EURY|nr:hypothetical protein HAPAU_28440 [Halalkalicoccus paucihalophilus]
MLIKYGVLVRFSAPILAGFEWMSVILVSAANRTLVTFRNSESLSMIQTLHRRTKIRESKEIKPIRVIKAEKEIKPIRVIKAEKEIKPIRVIKAEKEIKLIKKNRVNKAILGFAFGWTTCAQLLQPIKVM